MLTVSRLAGIAIAALTTACGDGGLPTAPSSSTNSSFLTGTWRGTITAQVDGAAVSIPTTWTIAAPHGIGQHTGTLVLQHPSFPAALAASALVMAPWTPPAELLIDASWEAALGCRAYVSGHATVDRTRLSGTVNVDDACRPAGTRAISTATWS